MSYILKQIRYYKDNVENTNVSAADLISGEAFVGGSILQLGIQGLPGTKFYINDSLQPMFLDASGIFSLEAKNGGKIGSLRFDNTGIQRISNTNNDFAYLIVDLLMEKKED